MQVDEAFIVHITHPLIEVEMLDAGSVERRRAAYDAVYLITFFKKKLSQERAILTRNTCNKCNLFFIHINNFLINNPIKSI